MFKQLAKINNKKLFLQSLQEMSNLVHYVLKKFRGDQIQLADYALKSAGKYRNKIEKMNVLFFLKKGII